MHTPDILKPTIAGAVALLLATTAADAQRRLPARGSGGLILPEPVPRSVTLDLGAALDERWRVLVEPIALGRVTFGVSGQWTTAPDRATPGSSGLLGAAMLVPPDGDEPCTSEICITGVPGIYPSYQQRVRYRAGAATLHVRWYPELLSLGEEGRSAQVYVGEFIGYHRRRITTTTRYGWGGPMPAGGSAGVPEPTRPDSLTLPPVLPPVLPPPPRDERVTQHLRGWEPGLEFGVRGQLGRRALLDLGVSTRLLTIDDPLSARRPGQTDTRLVLGVGIGW
jgi:hypothetical protein